MPASQPLASRNNGLMDTISAQLFLLHCLMSPSFSFYLPFLPLASSVLFSSCLPLPYPETLPTTLLSLHSIKAWGKGWRLNDRSSHLNSPPILDEGIRELEISCHSRVLRTSQARNSIITDSVNASPMLFLS